MRTARPRRFQARTGSGGAPAEITTLIPGAGVRPARCVVRVELTLAAPREQREDPDVVVAHDGPSVRLGSATATAIE